MIMQLRLLWLMLSNKDKLLICNNSSSLDFILSISSFLLRCTVLLLYPQVPVLHILLCNSSLIIMPCSSNNSHFHSYTLMRLPRLIYFFSSSTKDRLHSLRIILLPLFNRRFMILLRPRLLPLLILSFTSVLTSLLSMR